MLTVDPPVHATLAYIALSTIRSEHEVTLDMMKRWNADGEPLPVPVQTTPYDKDKPCAVCGWPFYASGHEDGFHCPDSVMYRDRYVKRGQTIAQIAAWCDRSTVYVRDRLLWAGVELRERGRKPV